MHESRSLVLQDNINFEDGLDVMLPALAQTSVHALVQGNSKLCEAPDAHAST
jgi:hypothetical protein